ncbi:ABC transporter substrate-binding protein [Alkalilacustris brevis]|uniref:ABC transporter substrate-binding protein n=1 Tax=Alkalilacustris brevis TaxID=2026338 RepID=UPI000E0DEF19|nr:ABC transporter substrate-binding protein [Alkalilacustris brevis]
MRIPLLAAGALLASLAHTAGAEPPDPADWPAVLAEAEGQTVYWHAWGGDPRINDFIGWVGRELDARHGVRLVHVKLADTADAVTRVIAEASAGRDEGGAVDAIWINGTNFLSMKEQGLLYGPFAQDLPNWVFVDTQANPTVEIDYTTPVEGLGAPWAMFRKVFEYDSARVPEPPRNAAALAEWVRASPGRFTYPQPPDFAGMGFLKQLLIELTDAPEALQRPVDEADYDAVTAPLWGWLDQVTPHLWRAGRAYPQNEPGLGQLLADGEVDIGFSYNPGRVSAAIAGAELPDTARTFVFENGTLGNSSFLSIPYNAANKAGALVLANLILEPAVQARAQNPDVLGFQTVLGMDLLAPEDRARFAALDLGIATLPPDEMGPALLEPHPSWETRLAADWRQRFGLAE